MRHGNIMKKKKKNSMDTQYYGNNKCKKIAQLY